MPGNSTKSIIIFAFTIAIAMAGHWAEKNKGEFSGSNRAPASLKGLANKKMAVFNEEDLSRPRHTEKLKAASDVIIQLASAKPEKEGDIFVLMATVSTTDTLERLEAKWAPGTAEVVSGNRFENHGAMEAGQTRSFSITLRAGKDTNEQIHLLVKTKLHNGPEQTLSAQYNSHDQEEIDAANDLQREFIKTLAKEEQGTKKNRLMH